MTANIYTHRDQKVLHSNMAKLTPRGQRAAAKRLGAGGTAERDKLAAGDRDGETKEE